jgi:diphthamide biosynthesis protein 4
MASQAEIRAAYLQGARKHHPDKQNGEGDNLIQRLNEAHATLSDSTLRTKYDQQLRGQGSSTNTSRVTSEVDLDSFEMMESPESSSLMSFYYPCRCGNGFYIDENQLQNGQDIISCSGCSEQIRVIWQDKQTNPVSAEATSKEEDDEDDQPSLSPWELGWITTIEQSAGKAPSRCTYDLSQDSFTRGDIWIYRPVWEVEYLGGPVTASWPPSLPGWEQLA